MAVQVLFEAPPNGVAVPGAGSASPDRRAGGTHRRLVVAGAVAGAAATVLVGLDGSPLWQASRVAGVAAGTWALVTVLDRAECRSAGRLAVLAGIPAVAVAVGFVPHWVRQGPWPVQAAAAALAGAGVYLVAAGGRLATAGRQAWVRIGSVVAVAVIVATATAIVAPSIAATNVPRPHLGADPADVGLPYEDVTVRTADGVPLAAWYVPSSNGSAVVLLHGAGSTRSDVLDHAAALARAGFGVLLLDARGHGGSGGRAMDFGWWGDDDIDAATQHLLDRPDVDPERIGVVGLSMGGEEAIGASGSNRHIRAVVAEGATGRAAEDDEWYSERFGWRGALQEVLDAVQDRVTDVLTSATVPTALREAVRASGDTRYLLITAGAVADEAWSAVHIAEAAPGRVEVWTVPGVAHTDGLREAPAEWTRRVVGFLSAILLDEGDGAAAGG